MAALRSDPTSASNLDDYSPVHYHLDIFCDFESKTLRGSVELTLKKRSSSLCSKVILDSQDIQIHSVKRGSQALSFLVHPFRKYGSALHIDIPDDLQNLTEFKLSISFTSGSGAALCWLDPVQTAGKKMPYLFTQGQAVLNRSFFPCMDSPSVKSTWSASIKVPEGFNVVMSASQWKPPRQLDGHLECCFNMDVPIPIYLLAMAVGDIGSKEIGPRSRVWTEPCLLDKAQYEFQEVTEKFVSTGERLFGPYVWTRYDILVMPPSFPYGGMENPCLTFVTPTLLVGDRSLTDVIMHEISHSWFGNLVTNSSWSEFWLNEGLTMYAQRRICSEILGHPFTCLEAATGKALLLQDIELFGEDHNFTKLRVDLDPEDDPDDTYCEIPYEKGYCFVSYLRSLVTSHEEFDEFLKGYVKKYSYQSVVSSDFLDTFLEHFPNLKGVETRKGFEFDRWLDTPGTPVYFPDLSEGETLMKPAEALAEHWAQGSGPSGEGAVGIEAVKDWHTYQKLHFLDKLLSYDCLSHETLDCLARDYPFISQTHNAEIRLRWSQITLKNVYTRDFPNVRRFLNEQGKLKYTVPLYRIMVTGSKAVQEFAQSVFEETEAKLHQIVRDRVLRLLKEMKPADK